LSIIKSSQQKLLKKEIKVCRKKEKRNCSCFFHQQKNVITKKKCVKKFVCVLSACKLKYYMKNICPTTRKKERIKITKLSFRREK